MSNAVWITMWNVASYIWQPGDPMLPKADNTSSSNNKLRLILVLMELYVTPVNCFITESVLLILFTTPTHETGQNIVTELFLRTSNFAELFLMIFLWNQKVENILYNFWNLQEDCLYWKLQYWKLDFL